MANKSRADDRTDVGSPFTNCDGAQAVGRFGFGLLRNGRPGTLSTWRVSVTTPEIVARVTILFGGMPPKSIDADKFAWQVITEAVTVDVVLSGPPALRVHWRRDSCGRRCDGPDQSKRAECSCASLGLLADRKAAVRQGDGCVPNIEMSFRLRHDPALGLFTFTSGNWSFAEQAIVAKAALGRLAGPTRVQLGLRQTCHALHGGREVNYTRPTLALLGAVLPVRSGPRGDVTSAKYSTTPGQLAEPGRR